MNTNTTPQLTQQEKQILNMVRSGSTNKEIALAMSLSVRTVEYHLGKIFQKLDVSNRTAAVMTAVKLGLIED
ncbi:MAG: response regulator transcription factor [Anaerolineales bacterium]|nr:response regulator transcription factor [Anaerolineales bacterium]